MARPSYARAAALPLLPFFAFLNQLRSQVRMPSDPTNGQKRRDGTLQPRASYSFEPSKIAVDRTAGQRLCPFQTNTTCCISLEIERTNVRQDFLISVTSCEFAEPQAL